jgi:hypothetical protein
VALCAPHPFQTGVNSPKPRQTKGTTPSYCKLSGNSVILSTTCTRMNVSLTPSRPKRNDGDGNAISNKSMKSGYFVNTGILSVGSLPPFRSPRQTSVQAAIRETGWHVHGSLSLARRIESSSSKLSKVCLISLDCCSCREQNPLKSPLRRAGP